MVITRAEKVFRVEFKYNPRLVDAVKALPERRFDSINKCWTVPIAFEKEIGVFANRFNFAFGTHVDEEKYFDTLPMPELTQEISLKMKLFPYQENGVAYAIEKKRVIIGDQPGLGKTAQAIAAVTGTNQFPCLVICPSSLKINWQREWEMWTNKKAIILTDNLKNNFHLYYQTGLVQVFIVNFESLKKYFVQSISKPEGGKLTLKNITFKKQFTDMFKSVIIDESHRCFPYDTLISTNKGLIKIGEIVNKNMQNLFVQSVNLSNNFVSLKKIKNLYKNEIGFKQLYKIKHDRGELIATENHKIYTSAGRYKEVREIESGDYLYLLPEAIYDKQSRENNSSMLLQKLCFKNGKCTSRNQRTTEIKNVETFGRKSVRNLRTNISNITIQRKTILRSKLLCKVENVATGSNGQKQVAGKQIKNEYCDNYSNARSGIKKETFRANEIKQSYSHGRCNRENFSKTQRTSISQQRWQRTINSSTNETLGSVKPTRISTGISYYNGFHKRQISENTSLLQIGYCNTFNKIINRSGRVFTQNRKSENTRQIEDGSLELVRVESCEIYEPRNIERPFESFSDFASVYDLEVEDNHNYFANGILVSNCKSTATQQTKFTKGICNGKEYIYCLTGTPVINKPKDLISQLGIIDQMPAFGGYKNFVMRYCNGPNEASNLRELNYMLTSNCFYRRDKQEVLKDLPDKMRQIALCEISTRKEYIDAENDLRDYLVKYKDADDEKIARALRGEIMVKIGILKNISARGKIADVCEFIDDILDSGEKLVLFCHLREVIHEFKKHYPKAVTITGEDDNTARQNAIDSFQKNPNIQLIICSIKAAGVGLTLTASSRVAFVELPWTAADCDQCEDRVHRIGQKDSVQATYFLGSNTIDEKIYKIIQVKRDIAKQITGSTEQIEENIVDLMLNLFTKPEEDAA